MKLLDQSRSRRSLPRSSACSSLGAGEYGYSDYALVRVQRVKVGDGSMSVVPPRPWNRHRPILFDGRPRRRGLDAQRPDLDGISFVTGLKSGQLPDPPAPAAPTSRCRSSART